MTTTEYNVVDVGEGQPSFFLKAVIFFKTALSRQLAEAIWIQEYGEDVVLNSRAEYNRSKNRTFNTRRGGQKKEVVVPGGCEVEEQHRRGH